MSGLKFLSDFENVAECKKIQLQKKILAHQLVEHI